MLKLRNDLRFTPQPDVSQPYYVLEDPMRAKFYRVGLPEYTFISLLDGKTTVAEALRLAAAARPDGDFTSVDAAAICRWLLERRLAHPSTPPDAARVIEAEAASRRQAGWQRFHPIVLRLPLVWPDAFFRRITPWLTWLYSPPAVFAWCVLIAMAAPNATAALLDLAAREGLRLAYRSDEASEADLKALPHAIQRYLDSR